MTDTRPVRDQARDAVRRAYNKAIDDRRPAEAYGDVADAVLALPVIADALAEVPLLVRFKAECDAVGIPYDPPGLVRHHRANAGLAASVAQSTAEYERDALRATVDRVRALLDEAQPLLTAAVSALYGAKVPEWDRVDDATRMVIAARGALDGTAQDEPRRIEWGIDKGGNGVRICRDEAQAREAAADPRRGGTAVFYDPSDPEAAWQPAPAAQGEPLTGDPTPSLPTKWRAGAGEPYTCGACHPNPCPDSPTGDPRPLPYMFCGDIRDHGPHDWPLEHFDRRCYGWGIADPRPETQR